MKASAPGADDVIGTTKSGPIRGGRNCGPPVHPFLGQRLALVAPAAPDSTPTTCVTGVGSGGEKAGGRKGLGGRAESQWISGDRGGSDLIVDCGQAGGTRRM